MTSDSGTDIGGSGDCSVLQKEVVNPFDIFPAEVWAHEIFPHVDKAHDLYSLYNTCEDLMYLLSGNKSSWLFPQILPHIYKYLSKNNLLKIRQICSQWMKCLDAYLDTLYQSQFTVLNKTTKMFPDHSEHPDRLLLEDGHEFMDLMMPIPRSPLSIVGGKVVISNARNWHMNEDYISWSDLELRNDFVMPSVDRVAIIGPTVRFLRVDLQISQVMATQVSLAQIYRYLQQYLTHMQNIEYFKLTLWYFATNNNAQLDELRASMLLQPLPQLPRLKFFEQNFHPNQLSRELESHFLQSYARVPVNWRWKICGDIDRPELDLPPAACFHSLREVTFTTYRIIDFDRIKRIQVPNLATLKIVISQRGKRQIMNATDLLETIQHFSQSLESIWINIWCSNVAGLQDLTPIPADLQFPRVTSLRLDTRERIRYNFLFCFPALEQLEIVNDQAAGEERQLRHIQPARFPDLHSWITKFQVEKSNVWQVLPNLRLIVIWIQNKRDRTYMSRRYRREQTPMEQAKRNRK